VNEHEVTHIFSRRLNPRNVKKTIVKEFGGSEIYNYFGVQGEYFI
jgi:hypothetical protein